MFDVIIIGYGPAGITAGIYAARKKLKVLLIGEMPGGEVRSSGALENWPGDGATDGGKLARKLIDHLKTHKEDVEIEIGVVESVIAKGSIFRCQTRGGKSYQSKSVIYATGRHPRLLEVPGEAEFTNKGISYCATCDGPLFADKAVAVIGGGNTGAEATIMLKNIASKVYLLHVGDKLPADPILVNNLTNDSKVEVIYQAKTIKISGNDFVQELDYEDTKTGKQRKIEVQGVFVNIGAVPNSAPVRDLVKLDEYGAVKADRYGRTNVPGFFAAGDVTDVRDAQIVVAAGHGCSAALSVGDYLSRQL